MEFSYKLVVDASQADAQLARTQKSAADLGGGLTTTEKALRGLDSAEREASKALRGLGSVMGGLSPQVMNLTGVVGDLAGLLTGGMIGVGLASLALAASKLYEAHKEGEENAKSYGLAIRGVQQSFASARLQEVENFKKRIDDLNTSLKNYGKTSGDILVGDLKGRVGGLKAEQARIEKYNASLERRLGTSMETIGQKMDPSITREQAVVLADVLANNRANLAAIKSELNALEPEIKRTEEAAKKLDTLSKNAKGAARGRPDAMSTLRGITGGWQEDGSLPYEKSLEEKRSDYENAESARLDAIKQANDAAIREMEEFTKEGEKEADALIEIQERAAKESKEVWANFGMTTASVAFSGLFSASQEFFELAAQGSEFAAQSAAASFLKSTGNQIVSMGVQNVIKGSLYALDPITAAAAPGLIAGGSAAIATGVAMGAGGAAISGSIPKPGSKGGGAPRERGTGPRRKSTGGGKSGGAGTVINVVYNGQSGPAAEDTARALSKRLKLARARRYT
jgi:hypothetical protein